MRKFLVTTSKESQAVLSYFAEFHDAYIESITLRSRYETLPDIQKLLPGFDVTIVLRHDSYAKDVPYNRKIVLEFLDVSDYRFDLRHIKSGELFIKNTLIQEAEEGNFALDLELTEVGEDGALVDVMKRVMKFKRAIVSEE